MLSDHHPHHHVYSTSADASAVIVSENRHRALTPAHEDISCRIINSSDHDTVLFLFLCLTSSFTFIYWLMYLVNDHKRHNNTEALDRSTPFTYYRFVLPHMSANGISRGSVPFPICATT